MAMRDALYLLCAVAVVAAGHMGCAKEIADPRSADIDHANPKSVLGGVFYAAETGDDKVLAELCEPGGAGTQSVLRICGLTKDSPEWSSFRQSFARGRLNGEPRISGDRALLHFVFGPEGKDSETMELIKVDGRWYLHGF